MRIDGITIIGLIAGIITTASFLPQVIKTAKTKDTKSLSLLMYLILTAGIFLWFLYGLLIKDMPVIIANGITFILSLTILIYKLGEKKREMKL